MRTTKKEEDYMEQLRRIQEEGEFQCIECHRRFTGMKEVHKHVERLEHHTFKRPGQHGVLLSVG